MQCERARERYRYTHTHIHTGVEWNNSPLPWDRKRESIRRKKWPREQYLEMIHQCSHHREETVMVWSDGGVSSHYGGNPCSIYTCLKQCCNLQLTQHYMSIRTNKHSSSGPKSQNNLCKLQIKLWHSHIPKLSTITHSLKIQIKIVIRWFKAMHRLLPTPSSSATSFEWEEDLVSRKEKI